MDKKMNWLDKFAEEQEKKLTKKASLEKKADQVIVDAEEFPDVENGQEVTYNDEMYKVVNNKFADEVGPGVLLEKVSVKEAGIEDESVVVDSIDPIDPVNTVDETMNQEMGTSTLFNVETPIGGKKVTDAPEHATQPDQGAMYDIDVQTAESDKFNAEAIQTEQQIASENTVDGTTPEGRVNRILQRMMVPEQSMLPVEEPVAEPVAEPIIEEPVVEEPIVEEVPVEDEVEVEPEVELEDEEVNKFASNKILRKIISCRE